MTHTLYIRRIFFLCSHIKFSKHKSFIICEIVTSSWPQKIQGTGYRVELLEGEVEIKVANIACHGDGNPSPFPNLSLERTCSWGGPSLLGVVSMGSFRPRLVSHNGPRRATIFYLGVARVLRPSAKVYRGGARSVQRLFHE